ncbi:hypothetical protein GLOTRDRAFT_118022 [Gloeophyllum trabeum ATCC 11539]|uniref:t-SNARE coiled-coil homology domain-containing protein n=1 Tax=Gloeophyllum trabeum (strain ATCC 11539 / FP-39264 / Madison 617) TaxID=670483 RepID=S7PUY6_GLOTA|nr:uncharacterized protein GLOTRDRAFT_118022 [Gloeophyllum trabeum ATCC 11539]EPQ51253.1 hypothetical protein GLOTRDRAFT_118022 [Gloeophyllum trabeum ATCC 11539]
MSSSRASARVEDTYEAQNDQRLDELHSKIRTLRGVTTDIHDDVERQNLMLDDTSNAFSSFGSSLADSGRRAAHAFGLGSGGVKQWRLIFYCLVFLVGLWLTWKIVWYWFFSS